MNVNNEAIIASAFESLIGAPVVAQFDKKLNSDVTYQPINPIHFHNAHLVGSVIPTNNNGNPNLGSYDFLSSQGIGNLNHQQQFIASQPITRTSVTFPRLSPVRYAPYFTSKTFQSQIIQRNQPRTPQPDRSQILQPIQSPIPQPIQSRTLQPDQ